MANHLNYALILDKMMQLLIKTILKKVEQHGLYDEHSIHITFLTNAPGVQLPEKIHNIFPHEITIVLQYQFEDLQVNTDNFSVALTFNGVQEKIIVPFKAIVGFVDPSANFAIGTRVDSKISINSPDKATNITKAKDAKQPKAKATVIRFNTIKSKHKKNKDHDK